MLECNGKRTERTQQGRIKEEDLLLVATSEVKIREDGRERASHPHGRKDKRKAYYSG